MRYIYWIRTGCAGPPDRERETAFNPDIESRGPFSKVEEEMTFVIGRRNWNSLDDADKDRFEIGIAESKLIGCVGRCARVDLGSH
jgi:hypothetical protein